MATERDHHPPGRRGPTRCPECGRRVEPVIIGRRHSMGTWIPVWGPGRCPDPACPRHAPPGEEAEPGSARDDTPDGDADTGPDDGGGARPGGGSGAGPGSRSHRASCEPEEPGQEPGTEG